MLIELKKEVKNLDGTPMEEVFLNEVLANALVNTPTIKNLATIKAFDYALTLQKEGKIEIDETDAKAIYKFVDEHEGMFILAKSPILKEFNNKMK